MWTQTLNTELRPTWKPHPSCSHHLRRAEFTIKESGVFFPKQTQNNGANKIIIRFCTIFMSNKQMEFKFYIHLKLTWIYFSIFFKGQYSKMFPREIQCTHLMTVFLYSSSGCGSVPPSDACHKYVIMRYWHSSNVLFFPQPKYLKFTVISYGTQSWPEQFLQNIMMSQLSFGPFGNKIS